jgi:hypothetical protein
MRTVDRQEGSLVRRNLATEITRADRAIAVNKQQIRQRQSARTRHGFLIHPQRRLVTLQMLESKLNQFAQFSFFGVRLCPPGWA